VIRKELEEQRAILHQRKTHKKGIRVKLQGQFVFSITKVLKIAREAEKTPVAKRTRGRPRKRLIKEVEEDKEEEEVLSDSTNSDSVRSVIVVEDM
jgi:hypothetical protein